MPGGEPEREVPEVVDFGVDGIITNDVRRAVTRFGPGEARGK